MRFGQSLFRDLLGSYLFRVSLSSYPFLTG